MWMWNNLNMFNTTESTTYSWVPQSQSAAEGQQRLRLQTPQLSEASKLVSKTPSKVSKAEETRKKGKMIKKYTIFKKSRTRLVQPSVLRWSGNAWCLSEAPKPQKFLRLNTLKMYNVIPNMVYYTFIENGLRLPLLQKLVKRL